MQILRIGFQGKSLAIQSYSKPIISYLQYRFKHLIINDNHEHETVKTITLPQHGNEAILEESAQDISATNHLRQLEYSIMESIIEFNNKNIWIHAGAVAQAGQAMLIAGQSGCGKSTISLGLCQHNGPWRFLGDDTIPICMDSQRAYPFLRTPWYRRAHDKELPSERIWELKKQDVELDESLVCQGPARLAMVIFPVYRYGAPVKSEHMSRMQVAWEVINNCVNFSAHGLEALKFISQITAIIPAFRIEYSDSQEAIQQVKELWDHQQHENSPAQALAQSPQV